jgi:hypothetical protein
MATRPRILVLVLDVGWLQSSAFGFVQSILMLEVVLCSFDVGMANAFQLEARCLRRLVYPCQSQAHDPHLVVICIFEDSSITGSWHCELPQLTRPWALLAHQLRLL